MKVDWDSLTIDKKFIFKYISQEQIFEKYLQLPVDDTVWYTNPLRAGDKKAGCKYFYGGDGRLWFNDFANRLYDCFNVVEIIYKCNYYKACQIIAEDFNLINLTSTRERVEIVEQPKKAKKEKVILRKKIKKYWTKEALEFWQQFGLKLTKEELINELYVHGIQPLDAAWLEYPDESLKLIYDYSKYKPAYCYTLSQDDEYQFYFPYNSRDKVRFMQSRNNLIHFYNNLPERGSYVLLTKSRKDAFLLRQMGVENTIAIISERNHLPFDILESLKDRFDNLFSLMDNDLTGVRAAIRLKKQGFTPLLIERELGKDFSDLLLNAGIEYTADLIQNTFEYYQL